MLDWDETTYQLTRAVGLAGAVVLGLALERWRPHRPLRPAWGTNMGLWAIDILITRAVCGACAWVVASWATSEGLGLLSWLGAAEWAAIAVGIIGLDAVSYAWHWANHRVPLLWRFHRVHHADASFHVTTALRFHPGELLLALPVRLAAVVLLGVPPQGVLLFELIFGVANLLEHGNFDLPRRAEPLVQRALITPALHRAHHISDWQELNTNFGTVLSVWDRMAGTFRRSDADRREATGLPDWTAAQPPSLSESLLLPLQPGRSPWPREVQSDRRL
jgi:sterol desaturase/sphingolipid hydroxylase (fatty acid hydroxylase superfamily)